MIRKMWWKVSDLQGIKICYKNIYSEIAKFFVVSDIFEPNYSTNYLTRLATKVGSYSHASQFTHETEYFVHKLSSVLVQNIDVEQI